MAKPDVYVFELIDEMRRAFDPELAKGFRVTVDGQIVRGSFSTDSQSTINPAEGVVTGSFELPTPDNGNTARMTLQRVSATSPESAELEQKDNDPIKASFTSRRFRESRRFEPQHDPVEGAVDVVGAIIRRRKRGY